MADEGSRSGKSGLIKPTLAIIAICFVAALVLFLFPPNGKTPFQTITPTEELVIKPSNTPSPPLPTATITPTFSPTPLVTDIKVIKWKIITICENSYVKSINIVGIVINSDSPSLKVEMAYKNSITLDGERTTFESPIQNQIIIEPPIKVYPDKYIAVTLKYDPPNGIPDWKGVLYFPAKSPNCY